MITFSYFLMTLLMFAGLFLIGLILLQRGRGGGLAGAFGGMGGQSAFGTKAGDVFTRITIGVAAAWILLCAGSVVALHNSTGQLITGLPDRARVNAGEDSKSKENSVRDAREGNDSDMNGVPAAPENKSSEPEGNVKKPEGDTNESDPASPSDTDKKTDNPAPEGEKN